MTATPPRPANEAQRLARLHALQVLDSAAEPLFDALAQAAARVAGTPIALLSLVDGERQWFKANVGLEGVSGTPRDAAFCAHAILSDQVMVVPDSQADQRFSANPLVTGEPAIRAYAGAPITLADGLTMGTLCVIDRRPRVLDPMQIDTLRLLASAAGHALEQRLAAMQREVALESQLRLQQAAIEDRARLAATLDGTGAGSWEWDSRSGELRVDARWSASIGGTFDWRRPHALDAWLDRVHPDDRESVLAAVQRHLRGITDHAECEYRLRHDDGRWRWMLARGRVGIRDADGRALKMFGIQSDVTHRRRDEERLRASEAFLDRTGRVAGVGGWEFDIDSGQITWSKQTCLLHGASPGHRPTLDEALAYYPPASRVVVQTALEQAIATGSGWDLEVAFESPARGPMWVRVVGAVEHVDGRAARLIGAFHDISERRALQLRSAESDRLLRRVADSVASRIAYVDRSLRYRFVNAAQCERFGRSGEQIVGRSGEELTGLAADPTVAAAVQAVLDGHEQRFEMVEAGAHGQRTIQCQLVPDQLPDGSVQGFFSTGVDITHLKAIERELAERSELMRVTLQSIGDAVITTDARRRVQWCNPMAERMTGWPHAEAAGRALTDVLDVVDQDSRLPADDPVAACLRQQQTVAGAGNLTLMLRDGSERAIEQSAAPMRGADGSVIGAVLVVRDASAQRRLDREMRRRAREDALTGLINRGEFDLQLERLVDGARSRGHSHALLVIDLDRFKAVNDAAGHAAGDRLLRQVAGLLVAAVRRRDTVARLGGDEFAVILEHCEAGVAQQVAQKIGDRIGAFRFDHEQRSFSIGASIGLVVVDARWRDAASLLDAADSACLAAKAAGRNRLHQWSEQGQPQRRRDAPEDWGGRLERALADGRFRLDAQRIVPLDDGGAADGLQAELLLQLCDADDGEPVPAAVFMPIAERLQIAGRIDRWLLARALEWLRRHRSSQLRHDLTIPLSNPSVGDAAYYRDAEALIGDAGVDPRQLCLAIAEQVALQPPQHAADGIARLRARGVRIAVDGFGGGGMAFGAWRGLPIDLLRIDERFVTNLASEPLNAIAVRGFAQVAGVLGLRTVATGVASAAALQALRPLGIDAAQGAALHRPAPLDTLLTQAPASAGVAVGAADCV